MRRRIAASRSRYSCSQEAPRPGADRVAGCAPGRAVSGSGAAGLFWCWMHAGWGNSCRAGSGGLAGGAALGVWGGTGGTCPPARSPLSPPPESTGGRELRGGRGLPMGAAVSEGRVALGSGADWTSSSTAAEAWLRWAKDWFLEASLARKGPRLAGAPVEWPYLWQKSK